MAWLRLGDNAATYPPLMAVAGFKGADERTVNELFGFLVRLSTQSSSHLTDYRVDFGTASLIGGGRTEYLLKLAVKAGLLSKHGSGDSTAWAIVDDDQFIHMPTKAEVLWKRQRDRDRKNESLTVPVRLRDGDECRYCAKIVNWADHVSAKGGTYEHLHPGEGGTVETIVVACKSCNSRWQDTDFEVKRAYLRPVPTQPFYSVQSAEWLTKRGYPTRPTPPPSVSERGGAGSAGSTPTPRPAPSSRPLNRDTAVQHRPEPTGPDTEVAQRVESTDETTAASARDLGQGHRRASGSDPVTDWTTQPPPQRPEFLSDNAASVVQAQPGATHAAGSAPPQRMGSPPQPQDAFRREPMESDGIEGWKPGRVGLGRVGSGTGSREAGGGLPDSSVDRSLSARASRRKRARRSKKE